MMNIFKKKCSVCGTELDSGREYLEKDGKKFDSEACKAKYEKDMVDEQLSSSGCCCH